MVIIGIMSEQKNYENFRYDLGKRESGNNYKSKNTLGFLGRYQFGLARLCDFGLTERIKAGYSNECFVWAKGYSEETFLTNEALQDDIFDKHVKDIINKVQKEFLSIIGTTQRGILISLSGLVAGCHIAGLGGVKDFIYYGVVVKDAYGTSVKDYLKNFSGYDLTKVI